LEKAVAGASPYSKLPPRVSPPVTESEAAVSFIHDADDPSFKASAKLPGFE
jgi:hypothetical protein